MVVPTGQSALFWPEMKMVEDKSHVVAEHAFHSPRNDMCTNHT